jgi:hypothetical protein
MISTINIIIALLLLILVIMLSSKWYIAQDCCWGLSKFGGKYRVYEIKNNLSGSREYYATYLAGKVFWLIPIWAPFRKDNYDKYADTYTLKENLIKDLEAYYKKSDAEVKKYINKREVFSKKFCDYLDFLVRNQSASESEKTTLIENGNLSKK